MFWCDLIVRVQPCLVVPILSLLSEQGILSWPKLLWKSSQSEFKFSIVFTFMHQWFSIQYGSFAIRSEAERVNKRVKSYVAIT